MTAALVAQPWWMVLSMVLMSLLVVVMGAVTWSFDLRRSRLPQATRWENLGQKLVSLDGQVIDKQAELQEIMRRIQDRDRIAAEVAALTDQLASLRLEIASLAEAERQVEEMKGKAADAAAAYALEKGRLEEARERLAEAERTHAELGQQLYARRRELERLPGTQEELKREIERLQGEKSTLEDGLATLRGERGLLLAAREEAAELATRKAGMQQEFEALQKTIADVRSGAIFANHEKERATLVRRMEELRQDRSKAEQLVAQIGDLTARKAALEVDIDNLREATAGSSDGDDLEDLRRRPQCLQHVTDKARAAQLEHEALYEVSQHLKMLDLKYNPRTIYAFHTALKINETSQMTVLAGVSGTGKSLLPRRYAEAMGLHFLQIAVEPRWDSPQDLLGFYNYVEKRYRGTELARALVHMDPFDTSDLSDEPLADHMLLVLLDEMNLARVEYYFSEFLSRLEVRPRWQDAQDEARRLGACMPIDIRGRQQTPVQLFPSHNVIFAGTMNDDESTQALSDKVLDRSNVMQFAAPGEFARPAEAANAPATPNYRSYAEWRKWIRPTEFLSGGERDKVQDVINRLARIMEEFGRPFGHRLNESILTYVANYPRNPAEPVDNPLADQIEFRILPKLRGLTIEEHQDQFGQLNRLVRDDLHDFDFASRLKELIDRQSNGSGQFNWRGLDRQG